MKSSVDKGENCVTMPIFRSTIIQNRTRKVRGN